MLYPLNTETRTVIDLNGIWKFKLEKDTPINPSYPLKDTLNMAVPGSYNEQTTSKEIRLHVGNVWYEREFNVPKILQSQKIFMRFESVTHEAVVYINGQEVATHKGGFTPFEVVINDSIQPGKNRLTVRVNNILDYSTLPVGIYREEKNERTGEISSINIPNFDFFNYAGIHRPVKIYTVPQAYIKDIILTYDLDIKSRIAKVKVETEVFGEFDNIIVRAIDEDESIVAESLVNGSELIISDVHVWEPLNAYLYKIQVELYKDNELIDVYEEMMGLRTIEVKESQFLINDKPFYFKGFGKHEDNYMRGRGLDEVSNVTDINLMKWIGANSFRTSHYPYSSEMMRLADREGIVIIDEVPAVGLYAGFNYSLVPRESLDDTWTKLTTKDAHEQALVELIERDKNHPSVVMWSIANEAATHQTGADDYFEPLVKLVKEKDPQKRPTTIVFIQESSPEEDKVSDLIDVLSLNRYYGWYIELDNLDTAQDMLRDELERWKERHPDKPIIFTEYGADTVSGFHSVTAEPFTEEYQIRYYDINHEVFDEYPQVIGEHVWNFADFETMAETKRVDGNKKGIFTRARKPKMIAYNLKNRWESIPNFNYKK